MAVPSQVMVEQKPVFWQTAWHGPPAPARKRVSLGWLASPGIQMGLYRQSTNLALSGPQWHATIMSLSGEANA